VRALGLMEVNRRLTELELVESMIRELDSEIYHAVSKDRDAQIVDSLPGIRLPTAPCSSRPS